MKKLVSVIRNGEKKISEVDFLSIRAGDIFFTDHVSSPKYAHRAIEKEIGVKGPYAFLVCDEKHAWWDSSHLLSDVKPYVITDVRAPYTIPSAQRLQPNYITESVMGLREARAAAVADGIKFIDDIPAIPKRWYIDTESNREIINSYLKNKNRLPGYPGNMLVYTDGQYISDLSFWGSGVFRELWNPHEKEYIPKEELPTALLYAHDNTWESNGDDYLVEYQGKYYLMLDHVYNGDNLSDYGVNTMGELFEVALENAQTAAQNELLRDCLVLASKSCKENGNMHFVSILVNAFASKDFVDKVKTVLSECMYKTPEKFKNRSLDEQIDSASSRAGKSQIDASEKGRESDIVLS